LYQPIKKFVSGGLFLAVITAFLCLVSPGRADAATAIYYSVGTDNTALYSGNASASSGTLTLASSGAAKIGVGDEIREGLNRYYITGRNSATEFTIQNSAANSGTPGDTNITFGTTSITIYRAFNTITAAISGSPDSSHLNLGGPPYDLTSGNYQLNIRIYTPVDSSEVGASQRHNGTAGTGFVLQSTCSSGCNHLFKIYDEHVRVEGIEIDGSAITDLVYAGIYAKNISAASDIRIDKVLVYDFTKLSAPSSDSEVYGIYISEGSVRVTNSIVYNITNENPGAGTTAIGIRHGSTGTSSFYNNTVYDVVNSGNSSDPAYGFYVDDGTVTATNNYVGGTSGGSAAYDFNGTMTMSGNMSSDATADGTTRDNKAPADQFISITAGSEDLHLKSGADAINAGDDLSGTFSGDIDGDVRPTGAGTWDIGADESSASPDPDDFTRDAGMVSWWYLDETSGIRYDGSGSSNNDLTDNNSVTSYLTTNQSVKEGAAAASFDGGLLQSLSVTDNASLSVTGNLTLVAWIRPTDISGDKGIMGKSDGVDQRSYYFYLDAGKLKVKLSPSGSGAYAPTAFTTLSVDTWYHVAMVYNGTDVRMYLDGVLDANGTDNPFAFNEGFFDSTAPFSIGSRGTTADYFDGQIDEAAVFNRALSADEITSIYENGLNGVTRMRPDAAQPPVPYFGRSIGEDTGTVYGTGTVTLNQGSRRASFSGATLPSNIGEGDKLLIGGSTTYYIASRESTTEVIVQEANISGSDHSAATYTIMRAYSGSDHTPFVNWESDRNGDLVTDDAIQRGICYKDSDGVFDFTSGVFVKDNNVKDSSHFMWLTAHSSARHSGKEGTGVAIDGNGPTESTDHLFNIEDEYTRMEWLEIKNFRGNLNARQPIIQQDGSYSAANSTFQNLLIHDFTSQGKGGINAYDDLTVRNCIIYDGDVGFRSYGDDLNQDVTLENLTVYGMTGDGVFIHDGTVIIKNTISVGCTADDFDINVADAGVAITYFGYNMYNDVNRFTPGDYQGNNQTPPGTLENLFVDSTSPGYDLHLESSGHNALDNGTDLSSSFTNDIDDETRPSGAGTWDIGADEYSAGGNSPPSLNVDEPDGTGDTVTVGDNFT
jgi:hypothetical protein